MLSAFYFLICRIAGSGGCRSASTGARPVGINRIVGFTRHTDAVCIGYECCCVCFISLEIFSLCILHSFFMVYGHDACLSDQLASWIYRILCALFTSANDDLFIFTSGLNSIRRSSNLLLLVGNRATDESSQQPQSAIQQRIRHERRGVRRR